MRRQVCLLALVLVVLMSSAPTFGQSENGQSENGQSENDSDKAANVVGDAVEVIDAIIGDDPANKGTELESAWEMVRAYVLENGIPNLEDAVAEVAKKSNAKVVKRGWWGSTHHHHHHVTYVTNGHQVIGGRKSK